jgi:hypothetical protein
MRSNTAAEALLFIEVALHLIKQAVSDLYELTHLVIETAGV